MVVTVGEDQNMIITTLLKAKMEKLFIEQNPTQQV